MLTSQTKNIETDRYQVIYCFEEQCIVANEELNATTWELEKPDCLKYESSDGTANATKYQ